MHYLACDLPGEAVQKRNAHRMWNNGQGWQAYGDLNLRTWYQSDLVTITDQAMTKHYFIAGQRIASKLVESLVPEVSQNLKDKPVTPLSGDIRDLAEATATRLKRDFDCLGIDYNAFYPGETRLQALEILQSAPEANEYQVFFYHSDHLGSSSFITDANGDATQHLQYLPFGEDLVHEQNTAAYLSPYTFSGKERDVETSLSYFGARYYEAGLSVWLSVDPMSDKYPSLSAYNYCALNPVMLVDPDGREIEIAANGKNYTYKEGKLYLDGKLYEGKVKGFLKDAKQSLDKLSSSAEGKVLVSQLEKSENKFVIDHAKNNPEGYKSQFWPSSPTSAYAAQQDNGTSGSSGGTIFWDPDGADLPTTAGINRNATIDLAHELSHASDADMGLMDARLDHQGVPRNEWQAVYSENLIRQNFGAPLRTHYGVSTDPSGKVLRGSGPSMLSPSLKIVRPSWY